MEPNATAYTVDPGNPKETIELIRALIKAFEAQRLIREDNKLDYKDATVAFAVMPTLYSGLVGFKYIDDELRQINAAGREKITAAISEMVIGDDLDLEELVEMYMHLVADIVRTAVRTMDYFKRPQAA